MHVTALCRGKGGELWWCSFLRSSTQERHKCLSGSALTARIAGICPSWLFVDKFAPACFRLTGRFNYQHEQQRVKIHPRGREQHKKSWDLTGITVDVDGITVDDGV